MRSLYSDGFLVAGHLYVGQTVLLHCLITRLVSQLVKFIYILLYRAV